MVNSTPHFQRSRTVDAVVWSSFLLQFGFLTFEAVEIYLRGELTIDYAVFGPAVQAISHLHLDPHVFMPDGRGIAPFLGNHFEWITWPIALLFGAILRLPAWVILLIICQALPAAMVGLLGSYYATHRAIRVGVSGLNKVVSELAPPLLGLTDIWLYWDNRFDFHYQTLQGALFVAVILALEVDNYVAAILLGVFLIGTGETAFVMFVPIIVWLLLHRKYWFATIAALAGIFDLYAPDLFGVLTQDHSALTVGYGYLEQGSAPPHSVIDLLRLALRHPLTLLAKVWSNRLDAWSEVAATGMVGLVSPVAFSLVLVVGLAAWSTGFGGFAGPVFQTIPIEEVLIFTSGVGLLAVLRRWSVYGRILAGLALAWSAGWIGVFGPVLVRQLASLSSVRLGQELHSLDQSLPATDVVLSTNATLGDFVNHKVELIGCTSHYSLPSSSFDVVADPWQGLQTCGPYEILKTLSAFGSLPNSVIIGPGSTGLYVIHVQSSHLPSVLNVSMNHPLTGKFLIDPGTSHGTPTESSSGSVLSSQGRQGFVVEGIVSDLTPDALFHVTVRLSVDGLASIQVWNDITNVELAQASVTSHSMESIEMSFNTGSFHKSVESSDGFGLFSTKLIPALRLNPIEIRVWSSSGSKVNVRSVSITR